MELVNDSYKNFPEIIKKPSLKEQILLEFQTMKTIFKPPLLRNTFLCCVIGCCLNFAYEAFYTWFPEIFQRFAELKAKNKTVNLKFCSISKDFINSTDEMVKFGICLEST